MTFVFRTQRAAHLHIGDGQEPGLEQLRMLREGHRRRQSAVPRLRQIAHVLARWPQTRSLTQRETEVLRFLLEKRKRKDIAQLLFVTESTIKKHTSNIYKKLDVADRAELFEKALAYLTQ